jgi:hypothetical protein
MSEKYTISVQEPSPNTFVFTFVLKERGPNGSVKRAPQYVVAACPKPWSVDWTGSPDDPGEARAELEQEVRIRLAARSEWIERVGNLVAQVEQLAKELGWSTRRIEKRLEDSYIGKHTVPALLMQEETVKILLEPVGRSATGTEGVVDLYLMPAYDDIASFYFYNGCWNLHFVPPGNNGVATPREAAARPLTRETLQAVLTELKQHAA